MTTTASLTTDQLIVRLSNLRFAASGSLNRRARQIVTVNARACEIVLADRGLTAAAIAAVK